jgi:HSP20 family protein
MSVNGRNQMRDFISMRDAMDRFLDDRWVSPGSWLTWAGSGTQYLPLDVYETADDVVVRALVPGVRADGIDVQYQQGTLTIRTKMEEAELPEGATWLLHEVGAGQSIRQVTLPPKVDVDQVRTTFEHGVLTLTLPKAADAKPKRIDVGAARGIGAGTGSR